MAKHKPNQQHGVQGQGGQAPHGAKQPERSNLLCQPAPFGFVPVEPKLAITAEPVFHDTRNPARLSGELHCRMTALTPLLCGNFLYEFKHLKTNVSELYIETLNKLLGPLTEEELETLESGKKVLEPLMLATDQSEGTEPGRVLIPGSQIKGMIRQSLQALLSAPMERVAERTFSFRPNLVDALRISPAIVATLCRNDSGLTSLKLMVVDNGCTNVVYVRPEVEPCIEKHLRDRGLLKAGDRLDSLGEDSPRAVVDGTLNGAEESVRTTRTGEIISRKLGNGVSYRTPGPMALCRYRGGLDGQETFAKGFAKAMGRNPSGVHAYHWVLVPNKQVQSIDLDSNSPALLNYKNTLRHLGDADLGHLRDHPHLRLMQNLGLEPQNTIRDFRSSYPQVGDLVFVEVDGHDNIISLGHHFRYRRRYRDTIHRSETHAVNTPGKPKEFHLRQILCPLADEMSPQQSEPYSGAPEKLTAARRTFGFVATEPGDSFRSFRDYPNQPMIFPARANSDFSQLAGRIAINWAVEDIGVVGTNMGPRSRFLRPKNDGFLLPLRPLCSPKASAPEHYLCQKGVNGRDDNGILCTYGDSSNDPSGQLAGRKFYLHQPDVVSNSPHYELPLFSENARPNADERDFLISDQATLARFVSCPKSQFKFTIRFRNLDQWELGAILFVLTADQAIINNFLDRLSHVDSRKTPAMAEWLKGLETWKQDEPGAKPGKGHPRPLLAMKIGHGRPLGLGSVKIRVDGGRTCVFDEKGMPRGDNGLDQQAMQNAIDAFAGELKDQFKAESGDQQPIDQWVETVFVPWLRVHRFAGRKQYSYPALSPKENEPETTLGYHSTLRRKHAEGRKKAKPPGVRSTQPVGLARPD